MGQRWWNARLAWRWGGCWKGFVGGTPHRNTHTHTCSAGPAKGSQQPPTSAPSKYRRPDKISGEAARSANARRYYGGNGRSLLTGGGVGMWLRVVNDRKTHWFDNIEKVTKNDGQKSEAALKWRLKKTWWRHQFENGTECDVIYRKWLLATTKCSRHFFTMRISMCSNQMIGPSWSRSGVSNVRPTGRIWPARWFNPAQL